MVPLAMLEPLQSPSAGDNSSLGLQLVDGHLIWLTVKPPRAKAKGSNAQGDKL